LKKFLFPILFLTLAGSQTIAGSGIPAEKDSLKKEHKVSLTGSLTASMQAYHVSGIPGRRENFTWRISGNPTLNAGDFHLPLHILVGSYQDALKQPFNKIGISPQYKWLKVHLGFNNVEFSKLVVSQRTFLGVGVELNPLIFRLGILYGRWQKAIEPDSTSAEPFTPAFKRKGYAVKIGFGKKDRYVDFIYFKGKDDTSSLHYEPYAIPIKPQENAALGIVLRQNIARKVFLEIDGAISLFSRDILARSYDKSDLSFAEKIKPIIPLRSSTQVLGALLSKIEYRGKSFKIGFGYDRITPDYETMGIYYFQNDVQRFTLSSDWRMLKKRMTVTAKIGLEKTNLLETLTATSTRTLALLNIFWMIDNNNNLNFFYSNNQQSVKDAREIPDTTYHSFTDSIHLGQAVNILSASFQHRWVKEKRNHILNFNGNYQSSRQYNDFETSQKVYSFNFLPDYSITFEKPHFTLLAGFEYSQFIADITIANYGPVIGITKQMLKKKMTASLRTNVSVNYTEGEPSAITTRLFLNFSYRIISKHLLKMRLVYLHRNSRELSSATFSELQGELGYTVQF